MTKILKIGNCDLIVKGAKAVLTGLCDAMARSFFNTYLAIYNTLIFALCQTIIILKIHSKDCQSSEISPNLLTLALVLDPGRGLNGFASM